MIRMFIERPILSTVISIIIVILGILGLLSLPVTQYPEIAPPTVMVRANYSGANAETVMKSVIIPIEEQVNGVEGMSYISSTASNDGGASVEVVFEQGTDPDIAAVNVQNRVSRATPLLPSEVTRAGIVTQKQQRSALIYMSFYSENPNYDAVFIENYININIVPQLKRIYGVGEANVFGNKVYSMRIWLDPAKLAAYNMVPADVLRAINDQSLEAGVGTLGQNDGSSFEYVIKYKGKFNEQAQYENIILKSMGQGQYLRLGDLAKVELDALSYSGSGEKDGFPSLSLGLFQTPGSNAQDIIKNIKRFLNEVEPTLPDGIHYTINYDTSEFLEASIEKVVSTLIEAFLLVFLVVFIFLQDFRSTLIPAIAVPVSIIGTFFFLNLFGFSLNLLTLFALVLAIGIVVDDAIVVVEAVHAKMDHGEHNSKRATHDAMQEITGAIVSITIVMAAVFLPVTFIQGPTGLFYKQFGITLIIAILISAVNALTLSPALSALFLKHSDSEHESNSGFLKRFFNRFNLGFEAMTNRYGKIFNSLNKHKWIVLVTLVVSLGITYLIQQNIKTGFVPNEDRGIIFANIELPPGASMERTYHVMKDLESKVKKVAGVKGFTFTTGRSIIAGSGSNFGLGFIRLLPFDQRAGYDDQQASEIIKKLFGIAGSITGAKMVFFGPASVPGFGNSAGFDFVLLDKTGGALDKLDATAKSMIEALSKRPEIQYAQTSFNTNYPQYQIDINVPKASDVGVSTNDILSALQGYIGGIYAADFTKYGKQYRVMIQAPPEDRKDELSLQSLYVRTASGMMAPLTQFVTLKKAFGPQSVTRYNLFSSVGISGANQEGFSTGDAINAVREVAAETLSPNYGIDFTGLSREEVKSTSQTLLILILSLVFVYFILAAQYESYILPLTVIVSLPLGVLGAYLGQWLFGLENNIYFQIALIMLIGLLAKNAILIVEFAVQRRRHGESIAHAAINAAQARLRPILMTSFAFIFGMMPLVLATGIGAIGNKSIATGAAFGLLIGTILGLLIIPILFVVFRSLDERWRPNLVIKSDEYEN